jgi:hypothetical protein
METSIIGKPIIKYFTKEIWCPSLEAIPATIKFALAPIKVPFPPKQAPSDKLHQRGFKSVIPIFPISFIMGIIVATKGILSTKAEIMALIHKISIVVAVSSPPVKEIAFFAKAAIKPVSTSPPTMTNNPIKKKRMHQLKQ